MQTQSISQNILAIQPQSAAKTSKANETGFSQVMTRNANASKEDTADRFTANTPNQEQTVKEAGASREELGQNRLPLKNGSETASDVEKPELDVVETKIVQTLEDIFGMSGEDIIDILEQLGLVPMDLALLVVPDVSMPDVRLVNVDSIKDFIMEMHGIDDESLFLVSDQMSGELTDVMNGIQELFSQEFGMDAGNLTEEETTLLRDFAAVMENPEASSVEDVSQPVISENAQNEEQVVLPNREEPELVSETEMEPVQEQVAWQDSTALKKADASVHVKEQSSIQHSVQSAVDDEEARVVSEFVNSVDSNAGKDAVKQSAVDDSKTAVAGEMQEIPVVVEVSEESGTSNDAFQKDGQKLPEQVKADGGRGMEKESPIMSFVDRLSENFEAVRQEGSLTARQITMNDIVQQVVNHVRIRVLPQTTSMELQLNPASLGRVNLNVTSQNGTATATLTVQNQVAKEALESQLTVLRENLESQGLKVEAVEVNVSEFGFKHPEDSNSNQAKQNKKSSQNKRFRFDTVDDVNDVEERDSEVAMADRRDGSSVVDYTA